MYSSTAPHVDIYIPEARERQKLGQEAHDAVVNDEVEEGGPTGPVVVGRRSPEAEGRACHAPQEVKAQNRKKTGQRKKKRKKTKVAVR